MADPSLYVLPGWNNYEQPFFQPQGSNITLPPTQSLGLGYSSTLGASSVIQFNKDEAGDLFEQFGVFNVATAPSVIAETLSLKNDLNAWDSLNVGTLYVSGDVTAGTEIVATLSNDGSGLLCVGGSLKALSITDNSDSVGTSGQVLTAGAGGQLAWATSGGGGSITTSANQIVFADGANALGGNDMLQFNTVGGLTIDNSITPITDNLHNLGTANYKFASTFTANLSVSNELSLGSLLNDSVKSYGSNGQVLTVNNSGGPVWATPSVFPYQAGNASIGGGGTVTVSFGTAFTDSVGVQASYVLGGSPAVLPLTVAPSSSGVTITGDAGASVTWFAYLLNQ